jgi:hypothetical protein
MRIEDICKLSTLEDVAADIPSEWYGRPAAKLRQLLKRLFKRRALIPESLELTRYAAPEKFPNWNPLDENGDELERGGDSLPNSHEVSVHPTDSMPSI